MKSNFTFKHLDYSESLVDYTHNKLDEIGQFLLKDGRSTVFYYKNQHDFVVEISINSKQKFFKAKASAPDAYVAVDMMIDKLEKQFLKIKEKYVGHKKFELSKEGKLRDYNHQFEYNPKWKKTG